MKKAVQVITTLMLCTVMAGCSNIITYVRHDETKGNIQCSGDQALKRDSQCHATATTK
ncbi:hypothetical protein [Scandinavium goeteborgense]|uniref:hypothetical protein n=1 Tax=Scandinavium goeteborgense TaxID=1851514 RepID=UPI0014463A87|nr:hypothetical protein [Scandinavium goeteborgense]QKN80800.1 hypothetical protein A8O29_005685 [Scandinavium goeteborgense]